MVFCLRIPAFYLLFFSAVLNNAPGFAQPDKNTRKQVFPPSIKKPLDFAGKAVSYFVNQSAAAGGDGTAQHPYRSINEALTKASQLHRPPVLNIVTGIYRENILINNNTLLRGITSAGLPEKTMGSMIVGTVQNNGPYILEMDNLRIANSPAPGAIVVNNAGATTILNNISIDRATRYGIYQKGGTLLVDTASVVYITPGIISETDKLKRLAEVICYGTGIFLYNVQADLSNLTLRSNVKGLMANGTGCNVTIRNMLAERHSTNPLLKDLVICRDYSFSNGLGCIEAANGARLQLQGIKIQDNDFCGLSVRDGARVSAYDFVVLRSNKVLCSGNKEHGGISVSVRGGGAWLELDQFELGHSLIGLQLVNATARCSNGKIQHNIIGIHLKDMPTGFNLADLQNNVLFLDNQRKLDAATVPVPGTGL